MYRKNKNPDGIHAWGKANPLSVSARSADIFFRYLNKRVYFSMDYFVYSPPIFANNLFIARSALRMSQVLSAVY
uniref:Uncharacterized protein n=1 Tax=Candidatus Kentrum sp. TUN TaxID=2126343 RepID=A0A450ZBU4_9GAMM|nr:MAG: hypothetical protein BECKTUN1418D_GA0071000_100536 [Candidatus Kentron sp. TUN]VFK52543.1 MAG: hypothetical protein BECKTUN1418F_GA0071002_100936 [Candidatus Kentron sp. TUN]VFK52862.1 MAG: hypothetical protein BECKTUN1418E_GA0071001_101036 [Candidatus Kentron sp. TUN]